MATFINEQQHLNIINDKSKQTKQHQQQQHHYYYFANYTTENKNVQEEISDGNNVDDFYHIKQCCYQPTTTIKSRTLNQRNQYILTTTTITTATSTTTSNAETLTTTPTTTTLSHVLHSLSSYNCRSSFVTVFLMGYLLLVQHYAMAAPQSCILCDKNDLQAKDPQTNYEEFLFEHQVTRQDAINALRQLNESFYEGTASDSSCNGVRCTEKVMKYCLGPQFINDHCWCEVGHSTEGLPFVPHICYVGEKIYKTSVGSCFFYEEVKDCCCSSLLAKEWRHISAGSSVYSKTLFHNYYVLALISLLYLLIRRSYN